jgi:hypothetical protein
MRAFLAHMLKVFEYQRCGREFGKEHRTSTLYNHVLLLQKLGETDGRSIAKAFPRHSIPLYAV